MRRERTPNHMNNRRLPRCVPDPVEAFLIPNPPRTSYTSASRTANREHGRARRSVATPPSCHQARPRTSVKSRIPRHRASGQLRTVECVPINATGRTGSTRLRTGVSPAGRWAPLRRRRSAALLRVSGPVVTVNMGNPPHSVGPEGKEQPPSPRKSHLAPCSRSTGAPMQRETPFSPRRHPGAFPEGPTDPR